MENKELDNFLNFCKTHQLTIDDMYEAVTEWIAKEKSRQCTKVLEDFGQLKLPVNCS